MVPLIRNCREILKENEQMVVIDEIKYRNFYFEYESFNGKIIFMKAERDKKIFKYFTKFFFMALRLRLMKPDI